MLDLLRLLLRLHIHEGAWPMKLRKGQPAYQRCLICGMRREYRLGMERQGSWEYDEQEQRGQRVLVLEKERG